MSNSIVTAFSRAVWHNDCSCQLRVLLRYQQNLNTRSEQKINFSPDLQVELNYTAYSTGPLLRDI